MILKSEKGISLLEMLVAIMLFGIGITMAMRTLPESNTITTRSRNITKATNFAQEKVEELMAAAYVDSNLDAGTHNDPLNPLENNFRRSWDVTVDAPIQGMKKVDVTVIFDTASTDSVVTLSTYITSRR